MDSISGNSAINHITNAESGLGNGDNPDYREQYIPQNHKYAREGIFAFILFIVVYSAWFASSNIVI